VSYFTSKRSLLHFGVYFVLVYTHCQIKFTGNRFIDCVTVIVAIHVLLKCESYYRHHILKEKLICFV